MPAREHGETDSGRLHRMAINNAGRGGQVVGRGCGSGPPQPRIPQQRWPQSWMTVRPTGRGVGCASCWGWDRCEAEPTSSSFSSSCPCTCSCFCLLLPLLFSDTAAIATSSARPPPSPPTQRQDALHSPHQPEAWLHQQPQRSKEGPARISHCSTKGGGSPHLGPGAVAQAGSSPDCSAEWTMAPVLSTER